MKFPPPAAIMSVGTFRGRYLDLSLKNKSRRLPFREKTLFFLTSRTTLPPNQRRLASETPFWLRKPFYAPEVHVRCPPTSTSTAFFPSRNFIFGLFRKLFPPKSLPERVPFPATSECCSLPSLQIPHLFFLLISCRAFFFLHDPSSSPFEPSNSSL